MKIILSTCFMLCLFITYGQTKKLCITVDDIPTVYYGQSNIEYSRDITNKLIQTFNQYKIPAIGYVNEIQLYSNGKRDSLRVDLLEMWLRNGYEIGNHTYSHLDFNKVTDSIYFQDVIKGERISRPLIQKYGQKLSYFRHPYLHAGSDTSRHKNLNAFLKKNQYTVSPVTIDNDDYLFARFYHKAFLDNNEHLMREIGKSYVDYMEEKLIYFEQKSVEVFGRNISQTVLIHASLLNADYLDELAAMYQKHGYLFVSQKEVLKDKAYQTKESYFTSKGISWIFRWGLSKGMNAHIMDGDIVTPDYIVNMNEHWE